MKFIFKYARLPHDKKLLESIDLAANRLFYKLGALNVDTLQISNYNKRYLKSKLDNLITNLQISSYILSWSLAKSNIPLNKLVFLDYGGGTGFLSLLAKELGINRVVYNDIYEVSCADARIMAESVGNVADYYVNGEIDDLIIFFRKRNINCDAIASYDVIEHIYDIEAFFEKIPCLPSNSLSVVMASGANSQNFLVKKRLKRTQLELEYKDRENKFGHKDRDSLRSYLSVRKDMICEHIQELNKSLTEYEINQLSKKTRGKIENDIRKSVDEYLKTGIFPEELKDPTNTCDPITGNWAEHFMDPFQLKRILSKEGFNACVLSGYYGRSKNVLKRSIAVFLNILISALRKQSIKIAPFYAIYGNRDIIYALENDQKDPSTFIVS